MMSSGARNVVAGISPGTWVILGLLIMNICDSLAYRQNTRQEMMAAVVASSWAKEGTPESFRRLEQTQKRLTLKAIRGSLN